MPKAFSKQERFIIHTRLKDEACTCLKTLGVRKTTVDELVKRVNIPKGTFYLFYPSKELLFYEVIMDFHDEIQKALQASLQNSKQPMDAQALADLLFTLFKRVDASFLATLIQNKEMELIMRKLPKEVTKQHSQTDDMNMHLFLSLLPGELDQGQVKVFSAALRAIFLTMLFKQEIGEDVFDDAMKLMIEGIVAQILKDRSV